MNSKMLLRQISISVFFAISIASATNAVDTNDTDLMHNLLDKAIQLEKSTLSLQRSQVGEARECLNDLGNNLELISVRIEGLYPIAALASLMGDKSDEKTVLKFLNSAVTNFLKYVEQGRDEINSIARDADCSSANVVVEKAKEISEFYDEATSVVGSITKAR